MGKIESKSYRVVKRVNEDARIFGLFFTTFFLWILASVIIFMTLFFILKVWGAILAILAIGLTYLVLQTIQTKIGMKTINKRLMEFYQPIHHIKIRTSIKRMF